MREELVQLVLPQLGGEGRPEGVEQERIDWESANNVTIEDLKRMSLESIDGKKKSKVKEANSYINGEKETQIRFRVR